jgi:4-hydroxyphenylpyruvate dioxygenase-like putative hemolysin
MITPETEAKFKEHIQELRQKGITDEMEIMYSFYDLVQSHVSYWINSSDIFNYALCLIDGDENELPIQRDKVNSTHFR